MMAAAIGVSLAADARAQCNLTPLAVGLRSPLGVTESNQGNLLVTETGIVTVPHSGRVSIVGPTGSRRTLIDGLPSARSDEGGVSGPSGLFMRGRTLYVSIGIGDSLQPPTPGSTARIGNPNPSSRLFSSVLAIHFSAHIEQTTGGVFLTLADQDDLADGRKVTLTDGSGGAVAIEMVANFPDHVPSPLPTFPANVRGSNPFALTMMGDQLYVSDGGRNLVWQTDVDSGAFAPLATFAPIANPLFPAVGGPVLEAVPAGIKELNGHLYVTLFRGFPFVAGTSVVEEIDPRTGDHAPVISGLVMTVGVLPFSDDGQQVEYFVLQHASSISLGPSGLTWVAPGFLRRYSPSGVTVLANCLSRPSSMVRSEKTGAVYVTEITGGRLVKID